MVIEICVQYSHLLQLSAEEDAANALNLGICWYSTWSSLYFPLDMSTGNRSLASVHSFHRFFYLCCWEIAKKKSFIAYIHRRSCYLLKSFCKKAAFSSQFHPWLQFSSTTTPPQHFTLITCWEQDSSSSSSSLSLLSVYISGCLQPQYATVVL